MNSKGSSSLSANIYGLQNGRGYCYTLSRILIARIQKNSKINTKRSDNPNNKQDNEQTAIKTEMQMRIRHT